MKNRIRIRSDENIVMNTAIDMLGSDDEYHDVRHAVTGATIILNVGEVARAHLDLIPCEAAVQANYFTQETLGAFAAALTAAGWTVTAPETIAA